MHNVLPGAKAYIAALQIALQRIGGRLICDADVQELLLDNRRVVGIRAMLGGEQREFGATHGVILAAGDYASNEQLIGRYKGDDFRKIDGINPFACGDGHRLAETARAKLVNMDVTYGPELRLIPNSKKPFQQWLPVRGPLIKLQGAIARRIPRWIMRVAVKRMLVTWQHPEAALFTDGAILLNRKVRGSSTKPNGLTVKFP
jgi:fumarate reductase flavoprotein subunit